MSVALYLDFLNSTTLDARVTAAGAGNGTIADNTGKITFPPNNRTTQSTDLSNVAWVPSHLTVAGNATLAPDGTTTAASLIPDNVNGGHFISGPNFFSVSGINIFSIYLKSNGYSKIAIRENASSGSYCAFDISGGGTVIDSGGAGNYTVLASGITSVGNGWFRAYVVFSISSPSSVNIGLYALSPSYTSGQPNGQNWTGNTTSGYYAWGAQVEAVTYQTTPGTYIPTTTTAYNGPRFDYDQVTLAPRGLMREPTRINQCVRSQELDNAAWTKGAITVVADSVSAPDGTISADKLTPTTASAIHFANSTSASVSGSFTQTVYIKANGYSKVAVRESATTGAYAAFDLAAVSVINTSVAGFVTAISASIVSIGNGWYRLSVSFTATGTNSVNLGVWVLPNNYISGTGVTSSWTGDGTSAIYAWGAQTEAGSFATSYIPTTSAAVTRSTDTFVMTGTNFSNWFNPLEGTFFAEWEEGGDSSLTQDVLSANDGSSTNTIILKRQNSTLLRQQVSVSGSVVCANGQTNNFLAGQLLRGAAAYKLNDFSFSANGAAVSTDTLGAIPTVSQLNIGVEADGSNGCCSHLRWIIYDNTRVVDASLVANSAFNIGTITGAATVAGGGAAVFPSVGSITGAATVSSTGRALFPSIGSSTGVGVATGIGLFPQTSISTSAGAATVSGVGLRIFLGVGSSVGAGVASGVGQNIFPSPGTIVGAATVMGIGAFGVPGVGTIIGAATVLGAGTELFPSVGFSEGASIVFANGQWGVARAPHIDGAALVFGVGADGHTVPSDRSFRIPVQRRSIAVSD